eukprot:GCRY01001252.1.p1 GENE.GCRY01001252.1~~GCRY01001252.1.p1  ORF type:complete len:146 (-),score=22.45 GCRY01001252.1:58-495(-)
MWVFLSVLPQFVFIGIIHYSHFLNFNHFFLFILFALLFIHKKVNMSEDAQSKVVLISADGDSFEITMEEACVSKTIKNMLTAPGHYAETETREITLKEISSPVMKKVIEYFRFRLKYANAPELPEFEIDPDIVLEVLMAANFLEC